MNAFREYLRGAVINEAIRTTGKFTYRGFNTKSSGVNGTYISLDIDDISFGIGLSWGPDFSAFILPNSRGDWRNETDDFVNILNSHFGVDKKAENLTVKTKDFLKFEKANEFMTFIKKNITNSDKLIHDLLFEVKQTIPDELQVLLMCNIKLNSFEKKFKEASYLDKIQLLIKQYKPKIEETGTIDFGDDVGYIRIDRNYWNIVGKLEDPILKMLIGRGGDVYFEIFRGMGIKSTTEINGVLNKSNILPDKTQIQFANWLINQRRK